jgi:hypothetical protein
MQGTILTNIGRSKIASATPESQLNITHVAVGDGNGGYPPISVDNTALINEVYRVEAQAPLRDANNADVLIFEGSISASAGPFTVREIGLFDIAGDLIAIGQVVATFKPAGSFTILVRVHIKLDNASDVQVVNTQVDLLNASSVSVVSSGIAGENTAQIALGNRAKTVASVADLVSVNTSFLSNGAVFIVTGYRPNSKTGGGEFIWDSSRIKSDHDGFNVIDPDRIYPDWGNAGQVAEWYITARNPAPTTNGCFVRKVYADISQTARGYTEDQPSTYGETFSRFVFGEEYMQAWTNALRSHRLTPPKIVHSGDSTTFGDGAGGFNPRVVTDNFAKSMGVRIESVTTAVSGQSTVTWDSSLVVQDITNHANMVCYVARWGINDGSAHGNANEYETALRSGLAKLRAHKSVSQLTIILMSPSSVYDPTNNRDYRWFEKINPIIRQAARDYKCVFFDTFAMFRDSKNGAGIWLDDPFGDGRGIHPTAELNAKIYSYLSTILFSSLKGFALELNRFESVHSGVALLTGSEGLSAFPYGVSMHRTLTGFPQDGAVITFKTPDNVMYQTNVGYITGISTYRVFNPANSTWGAFQSMGGGGGSASVEVATLAYDINWAQVGGQEPLRLIKNGRMRTLSGSATWTGGGTPTLASRIATLAVEDRPANNCQFVAKDNVNTTSFGTATIGVNSAGGVFLQGVSSGANYIMFLHASWVVPE